MHSKFKCCQICITLSLSSVFAAVLQDIAIFQGSFCSAFNSFVRLEFILGSVTTLISEALPSSIEQSNGTWHF